MLTEILILIVHKLTAAYSVIVAILKARRQQSGNRVYLQPLFSQKVDPGTKSVTSK